MALTDQQKKQLRGRSHALKPVVHIGQSGLTENVLQEVEQALEHHELIKLKARVGDRDARDAVIAELVTATGADLVQQIGNVAVIFRPAGHAA
jgi:RNA-binding protein